jgi:outer membrane receptor for ferrienterochelin and colicins
VKAAVWAALWVIALCSAAGPVHSQEPRVLTGRTTSGASGEAIAGAAVRVVGHSATAFSDDRGVWRLGPVPGGEIEIEVQHVAYATRRLDVGTGVQSPVQVSLTPRPVALSELVVTASRRMQQLKDVPVSTEVMGRAEMRQSGSTDLASVLVERTGVTAEGGHPVGTGIMLQGLGSERVLVLVDGQPMIGRLSGSLDLSRVPVGMIERVEVVKGPQSTLYGSDAMGGVVNIITRAPDRGVWQAGIDVIGGSRDRLDAGLDAQGSVGAVAWTADAGRRSIELVPGHGGDAGTVASRWDAASRLQWQASDGLTFFGGGMLLDESQRWRSGALYHFADNLQWSGRAGATWQRGGHSITPAVYATEFRHLSRRSTLPQALDGTGEEESQRLVEAEVQYGGRFGAVAVDAGIEARRESIASDRVQGTDRTLHTAEPFAQATLSNDRWSVVPGVRLSWSEQWGTNVTPRIAALFRPTEQLAIRASVGQGFRAPSFKELYMEFLNTGAGAGYRVRGNETLRPETSRNATAGIEWAGERLYARTQFFYNVFDQFIETVELADSGGLRLFTYGNIEDGATWGSELELGTTWRGFRAEAGYGYLVAEDRRTDQPLLGRPMHSGRASLGYARASGLRLTLTGVFTGRTLVARTDSTETQRAGFSRLDVRIAQSLPRGLELSAGIDNVADTRPEHWPGYVNRQFHIGIGWRAERAAR